jgi:nicotinamide-nucleotide amidase
LESSSVQECFEAALVLVGDELLDGRTRDRNLELSSRILASFGLRITECRVIPDSLEAVSSALNSLASPGKLLVTTGGLGPTDDDLTLEGVAAAASVRIERNDIALEMVRQRYTDLGREMPLSAMFQADIPTGAEPVPNPVGFAPGVVFAAPSMLVISVPGVPGEAEALLPECLEKAGFERASCTRSTPLVRTWGLSEIELYDLLSSKASGSHVELAFLPSSGRVDVRVAGDSAVEFAAMATALLGEAVYGSNPDITLEETIGNMLLDRGEVLAVAESCTGGMLGSLITSVPGSSLWFSGGIISYSNNAKTSLLNIPCSLLEKNGAVSRETVLAMASGVSNLLGSYAAIAISGVAGPEGGTAEKPVGTVWIAVGAGTRSESASYRFPGDRAEVRKAAVSQSLGMLFAILRETVD